MPIPSVMEQYTISKAPCQVVMQLIWIFCLIGLIKPFGPDGRLGRFRDVSMSDVSTLSGYGPVTARNPDVSMSSNWILMGGSASIDAGVQPTVAPLLVPIGNGVLSHWACYGVKKV